MKKFSLVFFMFLFTFNLFADDEEEKLRLAVMEFEDLSGKLSKNMLSRATELIRSKFVSSNKFIVIAKERQEKAMISEMKKESYKACNDKNCQIPLGQALSADTILRTTINFFGGVYTITSELVDLEKEATVEGAEATFDGSEKSLIPALNNIVTQIIGTKTQNSQTSVQDQRACERARKDKSLSTWEQYLEFFPRGGCAEEAKISMDKISCGQAEKESTIEGWEKYLKNYPKGECSFDAKVEIQKLETDKTIKAERRMKGDLDWSKKSVDQMNWKEAVNYCQNLTEDNHNDWRLPNIDELRTLIVNHPGTQTGGSCEISEKNGNLASKYEKKSCYGLENGNYSKLGDTDWFWSSSALANKKSRPWIINFSTGKIGHSDGKTPRHVRCVRNAD